MKPKPNLFVIGAPKSGTTTLAEFLRQHPQVHVSTPKETCFHILEYEKGNDYYLDNYFPGYKGEPVVCDASIMNLYFAEKTAERIHRDYPDAKLVVMLRDPIKRAFSDYRESVVRGLETLSFEASFDAEDERLKNDKKPLDERIYFRRGLYFRQLKYFLNYYNREQILILSYEKFFSDVRNGLDELFRFLGLSYSDSIDIGVTKNVNKDTVKNVFLQRFLRGDHFVGQTIKRVVPKLFWDSVLIIRRKLMDVNKTADMERTISRKFQERLSGFYYQSNQDLEKHLGFDLNDWNH